MNIETQTEVALREAGYETWPWSGGHEPVVCFESEALIGFVHMFPTGADLLQKWQNAQQIALARHAAPLRAAGGKAWNVYSVFLATDLPSPSLARRIERIEEDFSIARKIARVGVRTVADLNHALLPLLPVKSRPVIAAADYPARLRSHLRDLPFETVEAFLGSASVADVARILTDAP